MDSLKAVIKCIAISCPNRLTLNQLQNDYKEMEGHWMPSKKFGYASVENMIRYGMKDAVQIYGMGPNAWIVPLVDERSVHIAKMVREQKPSRKRQPPRFRSRPNYSEEHLRHDNFSNLKCVPKSENITINACYLKSHTSFHHQRHLNISMTRTSNIQEEVTVPNDITCSKDLSSSRYSSKQVHYEATKWEDYEADDEWTQKKANRAAALEILRTFQQEIAEKEKEVVEKKQDLTVWEEVEYKIEADEVASKKDHNELSDVSDLSLKAQEEFKSLDSECTPRGNITTDLGPICSDIYDEPKKEESKYESDKAIPDYAFDSNILMLDFPEFTVKYGTRIKPFDMPENIKIGSNISVYISEIHNPYRFWFHLRSESDELAEMMNNIQRFYGHLNLTCQYTIMRELIQPGQVCATMFNDFWHRAEILTNIYEDEKVKVYFMDYGTVFDVEMKTLKYLRTEFAHYSAFAYRGSLAEIIPIGLHWSTAASLQFLSMSSDRLLHAKVCEIDMENRVYNLIVCDTHGKESLHFSHELINMKHALKSYQWSKNSQCGTARIRHKREQYPTFDMLETGNYPTLIELIDMESKGIFYETITDKLIYHPHILNFDKDLADLLRDLPFYLLLNNPFAIDIINELRKEMTISSQGDLKYASSIKTF